MTILKSLESILNNKNSNNKSINVTTSSYNSNTNSGNKILTPTELNNTIAAAINRNCYYDYFNKCSEKR